MLNFTTKSVRRLIFIFLLVFLWKINTVPVSASVNPCNSDIVSDGIIDLTDYSVLVQNFLKSPLINPRADISSDGKVDLTDYSLLVSDFLKTCPPATPTITPTSTLPSQVLNLTNWKLQLPTGSEGSVTEIKQPALASYQIDPWYVINSTRDGVRFRAPVNGVTTSGSNYPRSELREMTNNGSTNASWTSGSGTHTMFLDQAFTAVPQTKKHVVAGQIHDSSDDVIVIRLEYPKLFIDINGSDGPTLDANYTLGKRFTVKFEASGNQTKIYYNGSTTPAYTLSKSYSGAYFKAGAYTQSNCSTEGTSSLCNANNYGEVVVYQAIVTHQ